jgi:protease-4
LIGVAVLVSAATMLLLYVIVSSEPAVQRNSTLMLRVRGQITETEPAGVIGQLFVSPPTVRSIVDNLRKAKVDRRISGVVLIPGGIETMWGKVQEIRDAVLDFKKSGKPIVAHLEFAGDQEYYLASACDRIFITPASTLDLDGLASYELFLRGTLDKIGAYPDLHHIGDYKTASNSLVEKTFTPAHREMVESLNGDLFEHLVGGIAAARKKTEADVLALVDQGPFLPEEAVRVGLVDDVAYEDELAERMRPGARDLAPIEGEDYADVSLASLDLNRGPRIAVVYASGLIASGESSSDGVDGSVLGSETIVKYLRRARDDESVRAIVLRIDSPGGSAVASDVIWREVLLARNKKPLVASMSDVAASGGYYIAMPAHAIVAQPGTLTGSIGVVLGKLVMSGTFDKLGMNVESISRGRFADLHSPIRPYSDAERVKVEEMMQATYDQFVEKAAQGRNTTPERIDAVAQGRVWTGAQGKQVGLVDELGGLAHAIAIAKERARIPAESEVQLIVYPPKPTLYELFSEPWGASASSLAAGVLGGAAELRAAAAISAPLRLFRRGEPLALMPNIFLRH